MIIRWLAWTCDAIDFFSVSLSIDRLERQFNRPAHDIVLYFKRRLITIDDSGADDFNHAHALIPITRRGASQFNPPTLSWCSWVFKVVFGIFSDCYGRKWPLVCNLLLISSLELCVGFVQTFRQFLALRSLFGIGMGGIWGLAASTALENLPVEARGVASGVLQQGYACGYLIAALVSLLIVPHATQGWRVMFWTACGISFTTACLRALLPESEYVLRAREVERYSGTDTSKKTKAFIKDVKEMLKQHWALCIYAVLLMAGTCPSFIAVMILYLWPVDLIVKDLTSSLMVLRYVGSSPHLILVQPDIFHFIGFVPYISRDNERFHVAWCNNCYYIRKLCQFAVYTLQILIMRISPFRVPFRAYSKFLFERRNNTSTEAV